MRIRIIGAGRVGAPLGAWFMLKEQHVKFIEINQELLEQVLTGNLPWEEPYLNETLEDEVPEFHIDDDDSCDWTFISVGTPVVNGIPVLDHIEGIVKDLELETNVVLRSTVAPGTCDALAKKFNRTIWHAPERLLLGQGMEELDDLPQIIGSTGPGEIISTNEFMRAFGGLFPKFVAGTAIEAECAKISNNIMRYIEFAAGTELSEQFEMLGANNRVVRNMMTDSYDRGRISFPSFVGSYCLNKDWQMLSHATGTRSIVASAADHYNQTLDRRLICENVGAFTNSSLAGKTVVILGLTYKPELDDCRESPSFRIIESCLAEECTNIIVHDPIVDVDKELALYCSSLRIMDDGFLKVTSTNDAQAAIRLADVVICATAHEEYSRNFDFKPDTIIVDPSGTLTSDSNFVWRA